MRRIIDSLKPNIWTITLILCLAAGITQAGMVGEYLYFDKIFDEGGNLKIDVNNSTYYVKELRSETGSVLWNTSAGDFPISGSSIVIVNSHTPWASLQEGETAAYWANGSQLVSGGDREVIATAISKTEGEVRLTAGSYSLSGLMINSQVKLIGEGDGTVIHHEGSVNHTISIAADNVVLKDFKLIGDSRASKNSVGIYADGYHFTIDGINITNYHQGGIKINNPDNSTVRQSRITGVGSEDYGDCFYASNSEDKLLVRDTYVNDCAGHNYDFVTTQLSSNWCYLCQP